ncbi:site-specific integrase [Chitinophaga sp.]|uniref:tyrosine-type recombinase/integrase n=1 Tax=Chitinophaga sp. TaxID=1869181 RepID=UPI0031DB9F65
MLKQGFTAPKLHSYDGDTSKEWYVGFRYTCMVRHQRKPFQVRAGINYFKTAKDRECEGATVVKLVKECLEAGWNPFENDLKAFMGQPSTVPEHKEALLSEMPFNNALEFAYKKKKASLKESSALQYGIVIDMALSAAKDIGINAMPVSNTKKHHIKLLLEQMAMNRQAVYDAEGRGQRFTPNSYNKYMLYIHSHFEELEEWGAVEYNPCSKIKLKDEVETGRHRHATDEEIALIKEKLPILAPDLYHFLRFEYVTGMRPKEILLTTPEMIDQLNSVIKLDYTEGKTKIYREVPLPGFLLEWINKRMAGLPPTWYIFSHKLRPGTTLKRSAYASAMWKAVVKDKPNEKSKYRPKERLGLPVSLYSFKGAGGDAKIDAGIPIKSVSVGWGHTSIATSKIYLKKEGERMRKQIIANAPDF